VPEPAHPSTAEAGSGRDADRPDLAAGQVVTVFRSRRQPGADREYDELAEAMLAAARRAPGFVDFKVFTAEDGERVSVITFASPEDHAAWRDDAGHRQAQTAGRASFYAEYSIQTGPCTYTRQWSRPPG
jgi:heme-degrading monooxygenase HmoA